MTNVIVASGFEDLVPDKPRGIRGALLAFRRFMGQKRLGAMGGCDHRVLSRDGTLRSVHRAL